MKTATLISAFVVIVIGLIHILFGALTHEKLTPDALWFEGSGLSMIFLGFINLFFLKVPQDRTMFWVTLFSNLCFLIFIALMNSVMVMVPGVVALVAVLILIITTWKNASLSQRESVG